MGTYHWQTLVNDDAKEKLINASQKVNCDIRIAGLLDRDYLFLVSEQELSQSQALSELVSFLADEFLLDQSSTEIITVHLNQLGDRVYRRFDIVWSGLGPMLVRPKARNPINKVQFLETLLACSISIDGDY